MEGIKATHLNKLFKTWETLKEKFAKYTFHSVIKISDRGESVINIAVTFITVRQYV